MIKALKQGYTMIELMVVVTLIAMLTVSIIGMFLSMVRGGGKAQGLALVKEEGDYAVSNLERIIRYGTSGCVQLNVSTDPSPNEFHLPINSILQLILNMTLVIKN
jgi:prepilin-type N-terminal cleavage/methylation domain-containing protein